MEDINCKIGTIVSYFVRAELLISEISFDMGISRSRFEFFGNPKTFKKIEKFIQDISELDFECKDSLLQTLNDFKNFIDHRNTLVHSLVLSNINNNEFMTIKYKYLEKDYRIYSCNEIESLIKELIDINNRLYLFKFPKHA